MSNRDFEISGIHGTGGKALPLVQQLPVSAGERQRIAAAHDVLIRGTETSTGQASVASLPAKPILQAPAKVSFGDDPQGGGDWMQIAQILGAFEALNGALVASANMRLGTAGSVIGSSIKAQINIDQTAATLGITTMLLNQVAQLKAEEAAAIEEEDQLRKNITRLQNGIQNFQKEKLSQEQARVEMQNAQQRMREAQQQIIEVEQELLAARAQAPQQKDQIDNLQSQNAHAKSRLKAAQAQLEELRAKAVNKGTLSKVQHTQTALDRLQQQLQAVQARRGQLTVRKRGLQGKLGQFLEELKQVQPHLKLFGQSQKNLGLLRQLGEVAGKSADVVEKPSDAQQMVEVEIVQQIIAQQQAIQKTLQKGHEEARAQEEALLKEKLKKAVLEAKEKAVQLSKVEGGITGDLALYGTQQRLLFADHACQTISEALPLLRAEERSLLLSDAPKPQLPA